MINVDVSISSMECGSMRARLQVSYCIISRGSENILRLKFVWIHREMLIDTGIID